ncbi:MAG TPA: hypothetical protein VF157_01525, partial [Chloroflexota bacterium]
MKPDAAELQQLAPEVPSRLIAEHMARLEESYFQRFEPPAIAAHLRGLAQLSPLNPAETLIDHRPDGRIDCTLLGFDAPALFSLATGILMSLGFSISSGDAFTYAPAMGPARRSRERPNPYVRRRVVDSFAGKLAASEPMDAWAVELRERLRRTVGLLERRGPDGQHEARQQVNEWVTERLERIGPARPRSPFATEVQLEPLASASLRLRVESEDTPAFLYSLSAALALHDVAIKRVHIETVDGHVSDQLDVELPSAGQPLWHEDQLRMAVLLTK